MKPAFSVICFTVLSGAGLGAIGLAALAVAFAAFGAQTFSAAEFRLTFAGSVAGLALTSLGLLSSTLHLANKKNAWRAFSRFRSSWLSREAVFAVLLYPLAGVYLLLLWRYGAGADVSSLGLALAALATALLALLTLFATGMIYAVLRTIPQWHTALVPLNYILLGLASGAALLQLLATAGGALGDRVLFVSGALLLLAVIGKLVYFYWIGTPSSGGATINTATGFSRAGVKLLDIGHSGATFNTKEFNYDVAAARLRLLRWGVFALLLVVPLAASAALWDNGEVWAAALIVASLLAGMLVERWLFFAEARHAVRLFHGAQRL